MPREFVSHLSLLTYRINTQEIYYTLLEVTFPVPRPHFVDQFATSVGWLIVPYLATRDDKILLREDDCGAKHSGPNTNPPVQEQNHLYKEAERLEASYLTLSN